MMMWHTSHLHVNYRKYNTGQKKQMENSLEGKVPCGGNARDFICGFAQVKSTEDFSSRQAMRFHKSDPHVMTVSVQKCEHAADFWIIQISTDFVADFCRFYYCQCSWCEIHAKDAAKSAAKFALNTFAADSRRDLPWKISTACGPCLTQLHLLAGLLIPHPW